MSDATEELSRRAKARVGTVLDEKWHIDSVLGVGGMAAVYAATHRNGKRAAIKLLHPEVSLNGNVKARFLREGWVANKVEHPGAVSVLDDDEAPDGSVFLVMELLEGETLESKCKYELKLPCADVLIITDQLLDVLVAAHGKGIVHRDLKPGNLFVTNQGLLKVLDFGIARLRELSTSPTPGTTTVSSMGTPGFMPPEQARGRWEEVDARSDLFAVGATMFNLLTGRFIHEETTLNEQLLASMTKPAPPLSVVAPSTPAVVAEIVDRALAFDPKARWASAHEMQEAVRAAYASLSGHPITLSTRLRVVPRVSVPDTLPDAESAPTLDVAESGAARALVSSPSSTSAKPVAVTAASPGVREAQRAQRGRNAGFLLGGAALLLAVSAILTRHPNSSPSVPSASGSSPPIEVTAAAPAPDPGPSVSAVASASASGAITEVPHPTSHPTPHSSPRTKASASAAVSAAPPADSVDIFGRRR